jgi:hypothetical protein
MLNNAAIKKLPTVTKAVNIPAYLSDISGEVLFSFLYNPQEIAFSRSADYSTVNTGGTGVQAAYWLRAQGRTYNFQDLLMDGYCDSKDITPAITALENLLVKPKPVYFTWGSELLGPCVLTNLDFTVDLFVNGKPSRAKYNISLKEIPSAASTPPTTISTSTKLTTRQRTEGRDKAMQYLQTHKNKLSAPLAQAVATNSYKMLTTDTGDIYTIYGAANTKVLVAKYDGKNIDITQNI